MSMHLWNKRKPLDEDLDSDTDDLYVIRKKIDAMLAAKEREIALLKAQVHDNTQFLQNVILELIHKGTTATAVRSPSVPLNSGANSTKSVKELNNEAKLAGPVAKLPD